MIRFIRNALVALLLSAAPLTTPLVAQAQSNPGLVYGQIPTAAQWNSYFAAKQDVLLVPSNSILGNTTGAGTAVRYITMPGGCTAANNALIWVTNVGWSCNTITASGTVTTGTANALGFYATTGTTISPVSSINNGTLITNGSGVPLLSLTLPATVQGNITTLGTISSGVWNATTLGVGYGGTGLTTWTSGGIPYASASNTLASSAVLVANGVVVGGGAGTTPATIATANNGTLITSAGGVPSISSTLPTTVQGNITRTGTLTTGSTGAGYTVAVGTSTITGVLPAANGGAGSVTGALKANGSGLVTQAACSDLSNGATGCSTATGTSGATIPLLNGTNTWSGAQSYTVNDFVLKGSVSGNLTVNAASAAGTSTLVLPGGSTDFSATGGTSQVVKQTSSGGAFTVARLACSDLSDSGTGCTASGTAVSANTGTSGHVLGFLDGANTFSALQTINSGGLTVSSGTSALQALTATIGTFTGALDLGAAQVIRGYSAAISFASGTPIWQAAGTSPNTTNYLFARYTANGGTNNWAYYKSRGASIGASGIVSNGDGIATFHFYGDDGANPIEAAAIAATVSGTPALTRIGGSLVFQTATDASPSVLTTALTLSNAQAATFSSNVTLSSGVLTLPNGAVGAPSLNLGDATTGLYRVASGQIGITSGGVLQGTWLSTGLTMNANTLTFGDGATWAAAGLNATGTYTTASTDPFHLNYTMSYSSTSNGISGMALSPKMNPTGASGGNMQGISASAQLVTSAANVTTFRGINFSPSVASSYTGTLTQIENVIIGGITNSGSNTVPTGYQIHFSGNANGNGITTGTVNNYGIALDASTAAAASGGTINNFAVSSTVPTGSGAGTTSNYGVRITGNGGSGGGGTTTNYALYSDSTAASLLSGILQHPAGTVGAPSINFGDATSGLYRPASNQIAVALSGAQVLGLTTSGATVTGTLGSTGTASLGTGSTDYVTAAGGSTTATLGTNAGSLTIAPASNNATIISSAGNPILRFYNSSGGSDLKEWFVGQATSGDFGIRADKDDQSANTNAYAIARGTTYNVASHTWYTSTVAGTAVQSMQLTTTSLLVDKNTTIDGGFGLGIGATAASSGLIVGGGIPGSTIANTIQFGDNSGDAGFYIYGTDASTNGTLNLRSRRSDGTNDLALLASSTAGVISSAQPWTLSNTTIKMTGITTGTNADFLCRASDGTVLLQTSSCTISTRALKIDLGKAPFDPAAALRKIDVAYFRYKDAAVSTGDVVNAGKPETGLYAEDVAAAIPGSAVYWEDGKTVKSYRQPAVLAALVGGWNAHDIVLQALAASQVQLRAANDDLRAVNDDLRQRIEVLEARR